MEIKGKALSLTVAGFLVTLASSVSWAATITEQDDGTIKSVPSISTYITTGNDMDGLQVAVSYVSGGGQTIGWGDNVGAVGTGWSLTLNDYSLNTLQAHWTLSVTDSNLKIGSVDLYGFDYNVIFDIVPFPDEFTDGSNIGRWQVTSATTNGDVKVSFSDAIKLDSNLGDPLRDVYGTMSIDFTVLGGSGFGSGNVYVFRLDTDNITNPVPEPATMVLLGLGLLGCAGSRLRKRK
jgi:hypothetical protein